jgi:hypothetical protein
VTIAKSHTRRDVLSHFSVCLRGLLFTFVFVSLCVLLLFFFNFVLVSYDSYLSFLYLHNFATLHGTRYTFGKGGNQGARGNNAGGDFFVENVWEELDYPSEFFFDSAKGDLYLWHNGTVCLRSMHPLPFDVVAVFYLALALI